MEQIDLSKVTGAIAGEDGIRDANLYAEYRSGRCHLNIRSYLDDYGITCRAALDLIDMGFQISEVSSSGLRAAKYMPVAEFTIVYEQCEEFKRKR